MSVPEFKFQGQPLTEETMRMVTGMLMNTKNEKPLPEEEDLKTDFSTQMLLKRIEGYGLKFMISNFFLAASVLTFADNPGKLMILLWETNKYHKRTGKDFIGIEDWCLIFPDGTPSDDDMKTFWDSQKSDEDPLGNMLDNGSYWQ